MKGGDYLAPFVLIIIKEAEFVLAESAPFFIDDRDVLHSLAQEANRRFQRVFSRRFCDPKKGGSPGRFETD
jgi:hypothetical protein